MIDGSMLELAANIDLTAQVVALAKPHGVSVEGEVGIVGYANGLTSQHTSSTEAATFERETAIDALAISIGNLHLQTEKAAEIDLASLNAIEAVTRVPLVLHGGSGIPGTMRRQLARQTRIKKFNIGTELRMAFGSALRRTVIDHPQEFDRIALLSSTMPELRKIAASIMRELADKK